MSSFDDLPDDDDMFGEWVVCEKCGHREFQRHGFKEPLACDCAEADSPPARRPEASDPNNKVGDK